MPDLLAVALGFLVLAPLFVALERRWPATAAVPPFRLRERNLDLTWWFFSAALTGTLTRGFALGVMGLLTLARGVAPSWPAFVELWHTRSPLPWASVPLGAQVAAVLLLGDFLGYWSHRLRHWGPLWTFHAVHHSPRAVDALSAARMHPLDDLLDNVLVDVTLFCVGAPPWLVLSLSPVLYLHTLLTHANLPWGFGPLGRVLTSPRFHRWHHALEEGMPARGCNFAGMFALWDHLFGTAYMPEGREPQRFGLEPREALPERLFAQLTEPVARALRGLFGAAGSA